MQGQRAQVNGGRFDFDDGGTYCGGWEDGKAHGHGVCTGPKGQGEYSGSWHYGFEVSGVYTWPSGNTYEGQWQNGKRHGLGVETRGRWAYRGEWTQGLKGRYGVRQSLSSGAKYEGTWANGLQDGYGSETYADGGQNLKAPSGTYQGQWLRGLRHGYGVRVSAPFGLASHYRPKNIRASLTSLRSDQGEPESERDRKIDDCRGGFVLKAKSDEPLPRRRSLVERSSNLKKSIMQGLRIKKQRSTGDIDKRGTTTGGTGSIRSTASTASCASTDSGQSALTNTSMHTDSNLSFVSQDDIIDATVTETYMGEWKNDKRSGFGISERSDSLKYEGEWYNNKKYGYGVTTLKDGTKEEGKYKNNVLITSGKKKHLFPGRASKMRERIDSAVNAALRASQISLQKADIAMSRTATARSKGEQADISAIHAKEDSDIARINAKQFAPDFHQPGSDVLKRQLLQYGGHTDMNKMKGFKQRDDQPHNRSKSLFLPKKQLEGGIDMMEENENELESPNLGAHRDYHVGSASRIHGRLTVDDVPKSGAYLDPSSATDTGRYTNDSGRFMPDSGRFTSDSARYTNDSVRYTDGSGRYTNDSGRYPQDASRYASDSGRYPPDSQRYTDSGRYMEENDPMHRSASTRNYIQRDQQRYNITDESSITGSKYSITQAMNDHFDQYKREPVRASHTSNPHPAVEITRSPYGMDWTPDSGVSDSMDADDFSPTRQSQNPRRSTLPSLYPQQLYPGSVILPPTFESSTVTKTTDDTHLNSLAPRLVVENNVRKRVTAQVHVVPPEPPRRRPPPKRLPLESELDPRGLNVRASLPDIPTLMMKTPLMTREEISELSSMRREEMRRQRAEEERLQSNPLRFIYNPGLWDWFSRRQLVMLVILINISLSVMFFKLLS